MSTTKDNLYLISKLNLFDTFKITQNDPSRAQIPAV